MRACGKSLLLWRFSRQVGNQCGDGTDVRDDPKHDREHREPQGLARRRRGPLKIPLSRRLVSLVETAEERRIRGDGHLSPFVLPGLHVPPSIIPVTR